MRTYIRTVRTARGTAAEGDGKVCAGLSESELSHSSMPRGQQLIATIDDNKMAQKSLPAAQTFVQ